LAIEAQNYYARPRFHFEPIKSVVHDSAYVLLELASNRFVKPQLLSLLAGFIMPMQWTRSVM